MAIIKKTKISKTVKPKRKSLEKDFQTEPLAVGFYKRSLYLLFRRFSSKKVELRMTSGKDNTKFDGPSHVIKIIDEKNKKIKKKIF